MIKIGAKHFETDIYNNFSMVQLQWHWSISSQVIVDAAKARWYEIRDLQKDKNLFIVSDGAQEVLFKNIDCGLNTSLALKLANDKELSHIVLESHGFPVARTTFVHKGEIWFQLPDFSYPLVVKPIDGSHGDGVFTGIHDRQMLDTILEWSFGTHDRLLIQEQIVGEEVRVLVVGDRVICCKKRMPASVIWDGTSTIEELIDTENTNPLRGNVRYGEEPLSKIPKDERVIAHLDKSYGYDFTSVPDHGEVVELLSISNIGSWGTPADVTSQICDQIKDMCVQIAATFGLVVAGIDIISTDFSQPIHETGGVVLEVGATPGIGTDKAILGIDSGGAILDYVFGVS